MLETGRWDQTHWDQMTWEKMAFMLVVLFVGYLTYKMMRSQKGMFTRHNIGRSFVTLGVLALMLIAFVGLSVLMLRMG